MSGVESGEAAGATVVAVPWVAPDRGARRPDRSSPRSNAIDPGWLVRQVLVGTGGCE